MSPLKQALKKTKKPWPPQLNGVLYLLAVAISLFCAAYVFLFSVQLNRCATCEQKWSSATGEDTCRDPNGVPYQYGNKTITNSCDANTCAEEGGGASCPSPSTCPDTLSHYCGGGGANGGSLAWLEMALMSVVSSLFLSQTGSLFASKGASLI